MSYYGESDVAVVLTRQELLDFIKLQPKNPASGTDNYNIPKGPYPLLVVRHTKKDNMGVLYNSYTYFRPRDLYKYTQDFEDGMRAEVTRRYQEWYSHWYPEWYDQFSEWSKIYQAGSIASALANELRYKRYEIWQRMRKDLDITPPDFYGFKPHEELPGAWSYV